MKWKSWILRMTKKHRRPPLPPNKRHKDKRKQQKYPDALDRLTYDEAVYWPARVE